MASTIARVLQLSDLHFGTKGQPEVWNELVRFIRTDLRPDAILLTGDIVDTPKRKFFEQAAAALAELCQPYRDQGAPIQLLACPGNHDRFYRGNKLGIPWIFGERFERYFNKYFKEDQTIVKLKGLISLEVTCIDTTENVRFFARGGVLRKTLKRLEGNDKSKLDGSERSLRVLLMHHHLLPIPELESDGDGLFRPFLGATTMVANPGRVLQSLCKGRFDLVMHGHEHAFNLARFDSMGSDSLPITVVSAPSSSGVHTAKGCTLASARLNVLEIQADETLWLNRLEHDSFQQTWTSRERRVLMTDIDMRKAWFHRSPSALRPDVGGRTLFEHTKDFDVVVRRTDIDVELQKEQKLIVRTHSTRQGAEGLRVRYMQDGHMKEIANIPFRPHPEIVDLFEAVVPVDGLPAGWVFERLMLEYVLKGASEATLSRLRGRAESATEFFGKQNMECLYSGTKGKRVAWYEISLLLPLDLAPCRGLGGVQAYVQHREDKEPVLSVGLTRKIVPSGDGHYSLRIAYPDVHTKYWLAWPAFDDAAKPEPAREEADETG